MRKPNQDLAGCVRPAARADTPPGVPRVIMTLLVRDEEDILGANLAFHLAQGVERFIVMDHLSRDGSRDIIERYCRAGLAELLVQEDPGYRQAEWVTMMARKAFTDYRADWVINCDADEFWWPCQGNLPECLGAIPQNVGRVTVRRHNFPPTDSPAHHFLDRMTYRDTASVNSLGKPLPGKACHRGHASATVSMGNHAASVPGLTDSCDTSSIEVLHFPVRTRQQYAQKIETGVAALAAAPDIRGFATWRKLAGTTDGPSRHYDELCLGASSMPETLQHGRIVCDTRLRDFMRVRGLA
jgi:hypothetical protein